MKYDLSEFEKRVEQGYLRKSEKDDLVLYGYTDACTFARAWDEYTTIARGLILDKNTGEVVAKPFPKFFNLGEREETFLANLPKISYQAFEKVDGSLGIIFNYKGKWSVATRGSFYSDQAQMAQEILKKYDLSNVQENVTLLAEIVYPENKIIVNYGDTQALVLLALFNRETGEEYGHKDLRLLANATGLQVAVPYGYTIEEMIGLQETLPKDDEGFVVRYENGLRVKIKGKEYLRIAKLMSDLSPIALWETMKNGKVDTFYLQQLPEELRADYEPILAELEKQYVAVQSEVEKDVWTNNLTNTAPDWRKTVGIYLTKNKLKHSSAVFPFLLGKPDLVDKYIMKQIRPDGNNMRTNEQN